MKPKNFKHQTNVNSICIGACRTRFCMRSTWIMVCVVINILAWLCHFNFWIDGEFGSEVFAYWMMANMKSRPFQFIVAGVLFVVWLNVSITIVFGLFFFRKPTSKGYCCTNVCNIKLKAYSAEFQSCLKRIFITQELLISIWQDKLHRFYSIEYDFIPSFVAGKDVSYFVDHFDWPRTNIYKNLSTKRSDNFINSFEDMTN